MLFTKSKKVTLFALLFSLFLVAGVTLFAIDRFANEERDSRLPEEMHTLAKELKQFRQVNGKYPARITEIRESESLCVTYFYTKCRKVYYKPSPDLQDFRMAIHSFSWSILFYHPQISMTMDELSKLPQEVQDLLTKQYGTLCTLCMSYPAGRKDLHADDMSIPVYRETSPIFANPSEWPELL